MPINCSNLFIWITSKCSIIYPRKFYQGDLLFPSDSFPPLASGEEVSTVGILSPAPLQLELNFTHIWSLKLLSSKLSKERGKVMQNDSPLLPRGILSPKSPLMISTQWFATVSSTCLHQGNLGVDFVDFLSCIT